MKWPWQRGEEHKEHTDRWNEVSIQINQAEQDLNGIRRDYEDWIVRTNQFADVCMFALAERLKYDEAIVEMKRRADLRVPKYKELEAKKQQLIKEREELGEDF